VDVLVTMAVIAVLLSLLAPSLSSIRETARQVVCRSNIRQIGIGLTQFAAEHGDRLPHSVYVPEGPTNFKPWETMTLRIELGSVWDGLGLLYSEEYTTAAQVFYCPSHKGGNRYLVYEDAWASDTGLLIGNFQYRGRVQLVPAQPNSNGTDRLSAMRSGTTLLADGFRTQDDFNHEVGANLFRADSSVAWFSDRGNGFASQFSSLPKDGTAGLPTGNLVELLWQSLDR